MMSTIKELLIKQAEVGNTVLHHEVSCKCPFPDRFQWFLITNDRSWDTPSISSILNQPERLSKDTRFLFTLFTFESILFDM